MKYFVNETLYRTTLVLCDTEKNNIDIGIGDRLPEEMQTEDMLEYCEEYNGKYYYFGMGDGDDIATINEQGNTIAITFSRGGQLVLERANENTLKCTSVSQILTDIPNIPVGAEFTFTEVQE